MALFKILKGNKLDLPLLKTTGYMYITEDTGDMYVDISSSERIHLTSNDYVICNSNADAAIKTIEMVGFLDVPGAKLNVSFSKGHETIDGVINYFSISEVPIDFRDIVIAENTPYQFVRTADKWVCQGSNLSDLGVIASADELNYSVGLVGNIQNQINSVFNTLYAHERLMIQNGIIQCRASYSNGVLTLDQDLAYLALNNIWELRFIAPSDYLSSDTLKIASLTHDGTGSLYANYSLVDMNNSAISDGAWSQGAVISILINPQSNRAYINVGGSSGGQYIPVFGE